MMEYQVLPNVELKIRVQLASTDTGLYPQTKIYKESDDSLVATVNLSHTQSGLYVGSWTNTGERIRYYTQTIIYTDSGYTTESPVDRPDSDSINVGYNQSGGIFGGSSGSKVVRTALNDDEVSKIINGVIAELKPAIADKYSFDPTKETVKADLSSIATDLEAIKGQILTLQSDSMNMRDLTAKDIIKLKEELKMINGQDEEKRQSHKADILNNIKNSLNELEIKVSGMVDNKMGLIEEFKSNADMVLSRAEDVTDKMTQFFDKFGNNLLDLETYTDGMIMGTEEVKKEEQPQVKTKGMADIINLLESNASPLDVYAELKSLPNKEKESAFNMIMKRYPDMFKKLLQIMK
jgi:hypothetical protein